MPPTQEIDPKRLAFLREHPELYIPMEEDLIESEDLLDLPFAEDGEEQEVLFPPDDFKPGLLTDF